MKIPQGWEQIGPVFEIVLTSFIVKFVEKEIRMKKMKRIVLSTLVLVGLVSIMAVSIHSGRGAEGEVQWMTFEQAVEKSKTEKRKIFIDVYTDWCGWCKVMDKNTFSEPTIAKMLNEKFYPVKFNAEQREDVVFNGTTFKFIESGRSGYHQLAAALLNNQMSYPTVVFLDEEFRMIHPLPGFQKPPQFHMIAQFIGENYYKTEKFETWQTTKYKSPYGQEPKPNN
jgi:thioredoxin-related protein